MSIPSSSVHFMTSLKRRETFSKVDEITKELQARIGKVKRTGALVLILKEDRTVSESLSVGIARQHGPPVPPPKPMRTFQEHLTASRPVEQLRTTTLGRYGTNYKFKCKYERNDSSLQQVDFQPLPRPLCRHQSLSCQCATTVSLWTL